MIETITTFTGETINYDDVKHKYTTLDGRPLVGASSYAKQFGGTFNREAVLTKTASSWGVDRDALGDLWDINGRISNEFGSSIHTAMEAWFKHKDMGAKIASHKGHEHNYALPKNVHIRDIVLTFVNTFGDMQGIPEALVSAISLRMAGRIDLIHVKGEKVCRIGDYKTNNELDADKIFKYQNQLSFYACILKHHGWTVEGLDIYHHDGEKWKGIPLDVLPVVLYTPGARPPVWKGI